MARRLRKEGELRILWIGLVMKSMGGAKGKCSFGMNCMELTIVDEIANFVKESNHKNISTVT